MFGKRLERARKGAGLSLRALGDKVGVSQTAISKYEKELITPDSKILIKLSKVLDVNIEYFFRPERFTLTLENVEYRKREISKKNLDLINTKILNQIEKRFELESFFPTLPGGHNKKLDLPKDLPVSINHASEIDKLANELREYWKLGFNPISDLVDVLETHGIRIFIIDDNIDNKFDGLATKIKDTHIVVISKGWPGDRQRFTLCHELGHILLDGRLPDAFELTEERAADRFAGAFLLPEYAIKEELGRTRNFIETRELSLLKHEYGLSMQSIIIRAKQTSIIQQKQYSSLWGMFRKRGWLANEPGEQFPSEESHMFKQLVFHALAEEYIGESKAAELLDMSASKFYKYRLMEDDSAVIN